MEKYKRNITIYYIYVFLTQVLFLSAVLIPFFKDFGGLSQTQIQVLQSFFWLSVLFLEIPTGVIADKFGRKTSLLLGSLFWICGIIIYTSTSNFQIFMLGEFTLAIGSALMSGANQSLAYDSLVLLGKEDDSKKIFSKSEAFSMLGIFAGALIGSILGRFTEVRWIFFLSIIPQIMAFSIALLFKEPQMKTKKESQSWINIFKNGIGTVLHSHILKYLCLDLIIISAVSYYVIWLYQAKLYFINAPLYYFGIFSMILALFESIVLFKQSFWEKLFGGEKAYLKATTIITGAGFILAAFFDNWVGVLFLVILAGGFGLTRTSIYIAIANKHISSETRSTSISTINMIRGIFIAIINPIVGFSVDKNLNYTLIVLGVIAILGYMISSISTKKW